MARRWAPNDGGDSDNTGEPRPSAGRQTPAAHSLGFDDSWKAGNRNATGSSFGPAAIPPFKLSRDPIPMPDAEPPRRSGFIAALLRIAPVVLVSATAALIAVWVYSEHLGLDRSQVADFRPPAVPMVNSKDQGASDATSAAAASPLAAVAPTAPLSATRANAGGTVRGITDREIRFGMAAPFSGSAKELGHEMKIGIEAAFGLVNEADGIYGRQLTLVAADDGYEPVRTAEAVRGNTISETVNTTATTCNYRNMLEPI